MYSFASHARALGLPHTHRLLLLQGPEAVRMYEEHVRFMILAEHELCEETSAAADQEAFNSHLNLEQINKVL